MKTEKTCYARVYLGLREGYTGRIHNSEVVRRWLSEHCARVGLCVTLTPTEFIYKGGFDPGVVVGLINYPRFPSTSTTIRKRALEIADSLRRLLRQNRVSVEFPDDTVMLEGSDETPG